MIDLRDPVAKYYDATNASTSDIPFYLDHILPGDRMVLELGCGTGCVLLPLSEHCDLIVGVEKSRAMLEVCGQKLKQSDSANIELVGGDITTPDLGRWFGLITAPGKAMHNIETDQEIDRLFDTIERHLATSDACILSLFDPSALPKDLLTPGGNEEEIQAFEVLYKDGLLKQSYRKKRVRLSPLVVYTEITYRYYVNDEILDEASYVTTLRIHNPDEFTPVIRDHGFDIVDTWCGYVGETYGKGSELVVKFHRP